MSRVGDTQAFEDKYRAQPDPWSTQSKAYEAAKRERTIAACGPGPLGDVCELGAGLGLLAAEIAPRCTSLLALDAAPTAIAAAQERLAPFPHAEARVAELPDGLPAGPLDLVVASELLYYLPEPAFAAVLAWLVRTLRPRGRVVAVQWMGSAPDLARSADATGAALVALPELASASVDYGGDASAHYRLDVLERRR
jgi:SAM-dependent methyltransferase